MEYKLENIRSWEEMDVTWYVVITWNTVREYLWSHLKEERKKVKYALCNYYEKEENTMYFKVQNT
jgi:hypothetical protein